MEIQTLLACSTTAVCASLGIYTGYILLYYWNFHTPLFRIRFILQFLLCLLLGWLHLADMPAPEILGSVADVQWIIYKLIFCLLLFLTACLGHIFGLKAYRARETARLESLQTLKLFVLLRCEDGRRVTAELVHANATTALNLLYSKQCCFLTHTLSRMFLVGMLLCGLVLLLTAFK
jgi:hypothetical protein